MSRPNIVFFLVDDLGWKDLGCYGSSFYETPNIDTLCSEGMKFTEAYAACPVCSPTRGSILTGKYPARLGITDWIDWAAALHPARGRLIDVPYIKNMPLDEKTLAHSLSEGGYRTWHIGKWHLGGEGHYPEHVGFDVNIGGCEQGSPARGGYFSPWSIPALQAVEVPEGTYLTEYLTDKAVEMINGASDKPFFLNMWYYLVHTPIQAPEALIGKYKEKARKLGLDTLDPFEEGGFFPGEHKKDKRIQRRKIQSDPVYAAMVEMLDTSIGRIIEALKSSGAYRDTLIVFTSDNGGLATAESSPTSNAPLSEGKGWMYEGGVREPLIVSWPGRIAASSVCEEPVSSPDFYPTLLEAAGLPLQPQQHVDGVSFLPLLTPAAFAELPPSSEGGTSEKTASAGSPGRAADLSQSGKAAGGSSPGAGSAAAGTKSSAGTQKLFRRGPIYWHYPHYGNQGGTPGSSVRDGDWKLIYFYETDTYELYNIKNDPGEERECSGSRPEKFKELQEKLQKWIREIEAKIPQQNPDYEEWQGREPSCHTAQ
jgi:arylsulfatase A-like enzyme